MEKWVHPHNCRGISALVEVLQTSATVFPTPRILNQSKCSKNDHHSIVYNSEKKKRWWNGLHVHPLDWCWIDGLLWFHSSSCLDPVLLSSEIKWVKILGHGNMCARALSLSLSLIIFTCVYCNLSLNWGKRSQSECRILSTFFNTWYYFIKLSLMKRDYRKKFAGIPRRSSG